jgi:hypothetical protein
MSPFVEDSGQFCPPEEDYQGERYPQQEKDNRG